MNEQYTASVYCCDEQIATRVGNDIDVLYTWMLTQGAAHIGDINGEIMDNHSKKIIKTFRKSAVE